MTVSRERAAARTERRLAQLHDGSCFCGAVSYTVAGKPLLSAFCHCTNCQRLSGCPFVHTVHFLASAFAWTHAPPPGGDPASALDAYTIPAKPWKTRYRCRTCGACVASANARAETRSVWGAHLARTTAAPDGAGRIADWDAVRPTAHIFYGTRMLDVPDGLGKWEGYEGKSARLGLD
ncbi:Mss4-like protein [Epithele typhae]|uniref:Mss4-like protein n=1 Tax=Epithele typhae TaxID=378194 RepID=UPI00200745AF|nr:Mss4-like protein [Epithele typhae]KAH9919991.1 Mss4-like protein [Epithele typhae]